MIRMDLQTQLERLQSSLHMSDRKFTTRYKDYINISYFYRDESKFTKHSWDTIVKSMDILKMYPEGKNSVHIMCQIKQ